MYVLPKVDLLLAFFQTIQLFHDTKNMSQLKKSIATGGSAVIK